MSNDDQDQPIHVVQVLLTVAVHAADSESAASLVSDTLGHPAALVENHGREGHAFDGDAARAAFSELERPHQERLAEINALTEQLADETRRPDERPPGCVNCGGPVRTRKLRHGWTCTRCVKWFAIEEAGSFELPDGQCLRLDGPVVLSDGRTTTYRKASAGDLDEHVAHFSQLAVLDARPRNRDLLQDCAVAGSFVRLAKWGNPSTRRASVPGD